MVQFDDIIEDEMPGYKRLIKNVPRLIPIPKEVHTYTPTEGEYAYERFWNQERVDSFGEYSFGIKNKNKLETNMDKDNIKIRNDRKKLYKDLKPTIKMNQEELIEHKN